MLELAGPLLPGQATENLRLAFPLSEELTKEGASLALYVAWEDTRRRRRRGDYPVDL